MTLCGCICQAYTLFRREEEAMDSAPLLLKVPEAAKLLQLGRDRVYELIASGRLPALYFGRTIRIPRDALTRFIENESNLAGHSTGS
jgi:excisionase family DNA binding protein